MNWIRYGEVAWNSARDWHTMPHRRTMLQTNVQNLILEDEVFRNEVFGFHEHWENLLQANEDNLQLRDLFNQFGVYSRYFRDKAEGEEKMPVFYDWLAAQQQEAAVAQEQANKELLPLTLAFQCRKLIDENRPLKPEELRPFLETLKRLSGRQAIPAAGGTKAIDAMLGGIALLLLLHRDWVREDSSRELWFRSQLEEAIRCPPGRQPFDFPESVGVWDWDTFAPESGMVLLAENPHDPLARELVLLGLSCFRYQTVAATMQRAYRLRESLGIEFDRMVQFVSEWSALRWALRWSDEWRLDTKQLWEKQCARRLSAFVAGGALPPGQNLNEVDEFGKQLAASLFAKLRIKVRRESEGRLLWLARWTGIPWVIDRLRTFFYSKKDEPQAVEAEDYGVFEPDIESPTLSRGIPPTWPGLDLDYLRSAFAWLDIAAKQNRISDDAMDALQGLLGVSLKTVPKSDSKMWHTSSRFPTKFDQWLYERISKAILRLSCEKARTLWQPVLALGVKRENWLKYFLSDCFRAAADKEVEPESFVTLWSQFIQFALDEHGWDAGVESRSDAGDVVHQLLGFDMGRAVFGDNALYLPLIAGMSPLFERAASRWFVFSRVAAGFCRFSLRPAGAELLLPGIRWLAIAEPSWSTWSWEHDGLANVLVDLMRVALDRHRTSIAANSELRIAFFHLCNQLVARGHPAALALRERIASC